MFEDLRKHASWIVIVIAAVFILSMAVGGISSAFIKKPFVAEIAGEKINPTEYQKYIEMTYSNYAQQNPDTQIDEKVAAQLKQETWQNVINEFLMTKALKDNHIKITDKDVLAALKEPSDQIKTIEIFHLDGEFDHDTYITQLTENEALANYIEEHVRSSLPQERLFEKIKSEIAITEEDVRANYVDTNNLADSKIIFFNPNKIKDVKVTDDDLNEYYEATKEDYKKGPARKIKYITLKLTPSELDKKNTEKRAIEIYEEIISGEDFATLAKEKSEGPSAPKGGDLGYFTQNKMVKPFADTAFAMKIGDISKPVQTRFGWHIIKVMDIKNNEAGEKEVKASHILLKDVASEETKIAFEQRAEDLFSATNVDGIDEAAKAMNEEAKETKEFYEDAKYISGIGNDPELINFAFKNRVGKLHNLISKDDSYTIAEISYKVGDHYQTMEEVKSTIERKVKKEKQVKKAIIAAEKFAINNDFSEYLVNAEKAEWEIIDQKDISSSSTIPKIGQDETLNSAILAKDEGEYTEVIKTEKAAYIAFVEKRTKADMDKFNLDIEKLTKKYTETKQNEHLNEWYRQITDDAEIIDNRAEFNF